MEVKFWVWMYNEQKTGMLFSKEMETVPTVGSIVSFLEKDSPRPFGNGTYIVRYVIWNADAPYSDKLLDNNEVDRLRSLTNVGVGVIVTRKQYFGSLGMYLSKDFLSDLKEDQEYITEYGDDIDQYM